MSFARPRWRGGCIALFILVVFAGVAIKVWLLSPPPIEHLRVLNVAHVAAHQFPFDPCEWAPTGASVGAVAIARCPQTAAWRLLLSGTSDWVDTVRQWELSSGAEVVLCDDRRWRLSSDGPFIGGRLLSEDRGGKPAVRPPGKLAVYQLFVRERGSLSAGQHLEESRQYDLARHALKLCIRLRGGAMYGAVATSQEVSLLVGRVR